MKIHPPQSTPNSSTHRRDDERFFKYGGRCVLKQMQWLLAWCILFACTAVAVRAANEFRVVDGTILGSDNRPFVIRGVNVEGLNYGWPGDVTQEVALITKVWGFNAIRVNCRVLEAKPHSNITSMADLDRIVRMYTALKVVVILEMHDRTGSFYEGPDQDKLSEALTQLAKKYRSNAYVWFNVMNEPGDKSSVERVATWVDLHRRIIRDIRDGARCDNVIVCDGTFWGQDLGPGQAQSTFPIERSAILTRGADLLRFNNRDYRNIVFSIHPYDQWAKGDEVQTRALLTDFVQQARARRLCVIFGEWGSGLVPGDRYFPVLARTLPHVAEDLQVGRLVWAWRGGDPFQLTKDGGGHLLKLDKRGQPTNLSWLGQLVWDDLQRAPLDRR